MFTRSSAILLVLVAALVMAACGSDDNSDASGSSTSTTESTTTETDSGSDGDSDGTTLELGVTGNEFKFDEEQLEAPAGTITLKLKNASSVAHNVALELDGEDQEGELVTDGGISEITVELKPGTYTYYCTPHKSIGMTGTLTVT